MEPTERQEVHEVHERTAAIEGRVTSLERGLADLGESVKSLVKTQEKFHISREEKDRELWAKIDGLKDHVATRGRLEPGMALGIIAVVMTGMTMVGGFGAFMIGQVSETLRGETRQVEQRAVTALDMAGANRQAMVEERVRSAREDGELQARLDGVEGVQARLMDKTFP